MILLIIIKQQSQMGPFLVKEMYTYPLWLHMTYTCATCYPAWPLCTTLSLFHTKRLLCWFYNMLTTPTTGLFRVCFRDSCAVRSISVQTSLWLWSLLHCSVNSAPLLPTPTLRKFSFSSFWRWHSLSRSTFVLHCLRSSLFLFFPPQECEPHQSVDLDFVTILSQTAPQTVPAVQGGLNK